MGIMYTPDTPSNAGQGIVGGLIDQIVYDALKSKMKGEEREHKKKKLSSWSLGETFIWISLAMPFIGTLQLYVFLLLIQHAADVLRHTQ